MTFQETKFCVFRQEKYFLTFWRQSSAFANNLKKNRSNATALINNSICVHGCLVFVSEPLQIMLWIVTHDSIGTNNGNSRFGDWNFKSERHNRNDIIQLEPSLISWPVQNMSMQLMACVKNGFCMPDVKRVPGQTFCRLKHRKEQLKSNKETWNCKQQIFFEEKI